MKRMRKVLKIILLVLAFVFVLNHDSTVQAANWTNTNVFTSGQVGQFSALETVQGQPAISFFDANARDLRYARFDGSSWRVQTVDSSGYVGISTDLTEVNGQPAISYRTAGSSFRLKVARYTGSGWDRDVVDSNATVQGYTSIANVAGNVGVAYFDAERGQVKYASFDGNRWQISVVERVGGGTGYLSLADVAGQPGVAYYDHNSRALKYARFNGSSWQSTVVDISANVGKYPSLAVVDGQPAISYTDFTGMNLKYARFNGSWWAVETVDRKGDVGLYTSLTTISGYPAISYFDFTNHALKYTWYNGNTWIVEMVDNGGKVGRYSSVAAVNGALGISYYDDDDFDLRYASLKPDFVVLTAPNRPLNIAESTTLEWFPLPGANSYRVEVTSPLGDFFAQDISNCGNLCSVTVPLNYAVGRFDVRIQPRSGSVNLPWSQTEFWVVPGTTQLTNADSIAPTDTLELTFPKAAGAYYTVVDVYYPNGGYDRRIVEAPACNNGTCRLSVPTYGLWGQYDVWIVGGWGATFGEWSYNSMTVAPEPVTLSWPRGTVSVKPNVALTFTMPDQAFFAVLDVYYPNGRQERFVVERPTHCEGNGCKLSLPTYGIKGEYQVYIIPGWGDQFGQWWGSSFTIGNNDVPLDVVEVDVLGSAAPQLPALDTSQVEAAVEGFGS